MVFSLHICHFIEFAKQCLEVSCLSWSNAPKSGFASVWRVIFTLPCAAIFFVGVSAGFFLLIYPWMIAVIYYLMCICQKLLWVALASMVNWDSEWNLYFRVLLKKVQRSWPVFQWLIDIHLRWWFWARMVGSYPILAWFLACAVKQELPDSNLYPQHNTLRVWLYLPGSHVPVHVFLLLYSSTWNLYTHRHVDRRLLFWNLHGGLLNVCGKIKEDKELWLPQNPPLHREEMA